MDVYSAKYNKLSVATPSPGNHARSQNRISKMSNNDKGLNILVAEDDPVSSKVLESFLAPFGTTTLAEDGEQAISALRAELEKGSVFDIIFLDIMMPEVDGVECVKLIREEEEKREIFGLAGVKIVMALVMQIVC